MKKKLLLTTTLPLLFAFYSSVLAHVVVVPTQTGIGTYQTFTVNVPVEKNTSVTSLRLVIPEGVDHVTPTVKPGWRIATKRTSSSPDSPITEIIWSGGTIPAGLRDEFSFRAKTPTNPSTLIWKAYQTYQDGSVVSWDVDPESITGEDGKSSGPYSTTDVVDDLTKSDSHTPSPFISFWISILALVTSSFTVYLQFYKHKK